MVVLNFCLSHIRQALEALYRPGDVVELRILKGGKGIISGYFDDLDKLAEAAAKFSGNYPAVYVTLNPVHRALLGRASNKVNTNATTTTTGKEVLKRRWLQGDIDPVRPSGVSSSNEEHTCALEKAKEIREWLTGIGWPQPMYADSGNGAHLNYNIDLPNNPASEKLIRDCLRALAYIFNDEKVLVDEKTFDANRLTKLYGTMACKGDNTPERPHRQSRILEVPEKIEPVPEAKLKALADLAPQEEPQQESRPSEDVFDIETWMQKHGIKVREVKKEADKTIFILEECPFDAEHKDSSIIQFTSGKLGFNCFHNSCRGNHWKQVRDKFESQKGGDEEENKRVPQAEALIGYCVQDGFFLFHDDRQDPYARVPISNNGHCADIRIRSKQFKRWLAKQLWEKAGKAPNAEAMGSALNVIEAMACHDGKRYPLKVRVAEASEKIYYDLTNPLCEAVEVDETGYRVIPSPILFRRYAHQAPQVYPEPGGKVEDVLKYINIKDVEQQHLTLVRLVADFVPDIPHTVTQSYGDHGSAKSTGDRVRKKLVDPSASEVLTFSKDRNELVQNAAHHYLTVFDNVSYIPKWVSDLICSIITGTGFSKRELYSDDEDVIYTLMHCIALNGISITGESPDLADRTIFQEYKRLSLSERLDEKTFWSEFEKDRPKILGAIFDCLSKAIPIRRNLKLPGLLRMADFTLWGYAIAEVLQFKGRGGKEFLKAYEANIAAQNQSILEASVIGDLVVLFMEDKVAWGGTPSELLAELAQLAEQYKVSTKQKGWPKAPNVLTKKLGGLRINLQEAGITFEKGKDSSGDKRLITLHKSRENSVRTVRPSEKQAEDGIKSDGAEKSNRPKDEASSGAQTKSDGKTVSSGVSSEKNQDVETVSDDTDASDAKIPTLKGVAPTRTLKIEKLDNPVRGRCSWCGEDRLLRWYVDGNSACNECKEDEEELAKTQSNDKSRKTLEVLGDFIREWYGDGVPEHPEDPDVRNIFIQTLITHCEKANIPITREEAKKIVEAEFRRRGWI